MESLDRVLDALETIKAENWTFQTENNTQVNFFGY